MQIFNRLETLFQEAEIPISECQLKPNALFDPFAIGEMAVI
jgi:hypothetical protein